MASPCVPATIERRSMTRSLPQRFGTPAHELRAAPALGGRFQLRLTRRATSRIIHRCSTWMTSALAGTSGDVLLKILCDYETASQLE